MIAKFLLTAFLGTSFLGNTVFASDIPSPEERRTLSLTPKQLKTGYEATAAGGFLELEDGTKWSVTNAYEWGQPSFEMAYYLFDEVYPMHMEGYTWGNNGVFNFSYYDGAPMLRWNEETQQMEDDPNAPPGGFEVFNLNVKRFFEKPIKCGGNEISVNEESKSLTLLNTQPTISLSLTPEILSITPETSSKVNIIDLTTVIEDFPYTSPTAHKFYTWQDPETQLWFGVEKLQKNKINDFWKYKIAYSTKFLFGKSQEEEERRVREMSQEEINLFYQQSIQWQEAMGSYGGGSVSLYSTQFMDVESLTSCLQFLPLDEEFETLLSEKGPDYPSHGTSYLDAFRAFQYNINKPDHAWVAYIGLPSLSADGPLYKKEKPSTAKILMAKTFCLSDNLYSAMGIFKDMMAEGASYPALSMKLQRYVARIIREALNPNISHLSFRPLTKMGEILTASNIPFSSSWGNMQCVIHPENPYIRINKDGQFELYDPQAQTIYRISHHHWFETHPFSGGVNIENIQAYPFITVKIVDLLK